MVSADPFRLIDLENVRPPQSMPWQNVDFDSELKR
jgi:hypothetical protein